ncbi:GPI mannosyltransferase I, putative [Hepatocystis sp. ex Piliocolobus tephrosceles]|nr:GPI mannosyltransferase I, putative [Hepatocystis sp. ex Piliocolobus tephrosceles]VWU52951.1 GPI mannosyltransferase I, putative [Hepatocystis sp. ex Piliocolobus tephrosceles]
MSLSIPKEHLQNIGRNTNCFKNVDISVITKFIYFIGILLRVVIYYYGEWQDNNLNVKFTDIDYYVFSDAAKYVLQNKSPYNRYTYRYTPLLAYLMLPNYFIHFSFGKILFSFMDFIVSIIIIKIIKIKYPDCKNYIYYVSMWILNPLVIIISIRGNSDCIPCLLVLLTVLFIYQKKTWLAAIFFGIAVNFKVYPIIYALPLMLYLNKNYLHKNKIFKKNNNNNNSCINTIVNICHAIKHLFIELFKLNYDQLVFFLCSFFTFLILNITFYLM